MDLAAIVHVDVPAVVGFYAFMTVVLGLWILAGYFGVPRGYRTMEALGGSTATYRVFAWIAERRRAFAAVSAIAFLAGLVIGSASGTGPGFVLGHLLALHGYIGLFLVGGSVLFARALDQAREEVEAGAEAPIEARSPWVRFLSQMAIGGVVFAIFWAKGAIQAHPWLWGAFFGLWVVQAAIVSWKSQSIARSISERVDRLLGLED